MRRANENRARASPSTQLSWVHERRIAMIRRISYSFDPALGDRMGMADLVRATELPLFLHRLSHARKYGGGVSIPPWLAMTDGERRMVSNQLSECRRMDVSFTRWKDGVTTHVRGFHKGERTPACTFTFTFGATGLGRLVGVMPSALRSPAII